MNAVEFLFEKQKIALKNMKNAHIRGKIFPLTHAESLRERELKLEADVAGRYAVELQLLLGSES